MLAAVLTVFSLLLLTRVLEPAGFGRYNMIVLSATAAFSILFGWVPAVVHRFHSAADFEGRATAWALGSGVLALAVLGTGAIVASFLLTPDWRLTAWLGLGFCLSHSINEIGLSGLRVHRRGKAFAFAVIARQVVGVGLALALAYAGFGYAGAVLGMTIGALVTGLHAFRTSVKLSSIGLPRWPALKAFLGFGVPLAVVASNSMLIVLITQSLLAAYVGVAAVGIYAAAQTLALRTISLPLMTLTQTTSASIFRAYEEKGEDAADGELDRQFSFLMLIALPIVVPLVFANDTISGLLFDDKFRAEVALNLPLLAVAAFIAGLQGGYFAYAFLIRRKTTVQSMIMIAGVVLHAGVATLAIRLFGAIGAPYAIIASSVISLTAYVLIGRSIRHQPIRTDAVRKAVLGALALVPFSLAADRSHDIALALLFLLAGCAVFFGVLYVQKQVAAVAVVRRLARRWRRTPAGE